MSGTNRQKRGSWHRAKTERHRHVQVQVSKKEDPVPKSLNTTAALASIRSKPSHLRTKEVGHGGNWDGLASHLPRGLKESQAFRGTMVHRQVLLMLDVACFAPRFCLSLIVRAYI
jgi:hypothetical protein